jgi:hypothetical protein
LMPDAGFHCFALSVQDALKEDLKQEWENF